MQLLWNFYNNLDLELEETAFTFFQALGGQSVMPPLDERVLGQVNGLMGDALGKLYVDEHFPPEAKAEMIDLVDGIVTAFGDRLERNEWMTPETRERALEKLSTLRVKVGYPDPDKWETYEDVEIGDSYFASVLSAANALTRESLAEAGFPVDREEWSMNAQTANAYYSPLNNEIVFPGRDPATAVLRLSGRSGLELRRDRLHHRARDYARVRSLGLQVRPEWQLGRLVDRCRPRAI